MYLWIFISSYFVHLEVFKGVTNLEGEFFLSKSHVFRRNESCQEDIDALPN